MRPPVRRANSGAEGRKPRPLPTVSAVSLQDLTSLNAGRRSAARAVSVPERRRGLRFQRFFTSSGLNVYATVDWELRDVRLTGTEGEIVFEQRGVEAPRRWSDGAVQVAASRYLRKPAGRPRETSLRQMVRRVAGTIAAWGSAAGYFAGPRDAAVFEAELAWLLLHQRASLNSPVWFNLGIEESPQCAGSFILSVADSLPSILELARTEGMLFKYGSGTGTNLSTLRSSRERLDGGGRASGPISFMRGLDALAGTLRSGGKTRRAAKMAILDAAHPDVVDFIRCKEGEERKAWSLIAAGYDGAFDAASGAYGSVGFQNANHSVRAPDAFLRAALGDGEWTTRAVSDGRPLETWRARDLLRAVAEAAWVCGDPGMQFEDAIAAAHPCPAGGRIRASNSCGEFLFLDDCACVLASLDSRRFDRPRRGFDAAGFRHACNVVLTAQEILIDRSGYPSATVGENTRRYRPLGLGLTDLGALLMARGLPYDSPAGRSLAAGIAALSAGAAAAWSARMAEVLGPYEGFEPNRTAALGVLHRHREALGRIDPGQAPAEILSAAQLAWEEATARAERSGLRNAQLTAIAPTGTTSLLMDCDTTGIEPDLALVKVKRLAGGGAMRIVNRTVPWALRRLGYGEEEVRAIVDHLCTNGTIEGAAPLRQEHAPVFDCALRPPGGSRSIHPRGHLEMLAAVQPFVSGGISKTVNLPEDATPEAIENTYVEAWRLGLKSVAVYRDGCKRSQPLSARRQQEDG